jgi:Carboxypeptidase regulatory-like domain/TonB dependent receptor-like, beta-barrel/TonB-dependent Receptor Plug Domain
MRTDPIVEVYRTLGQAVWMAGLVLLLASLGWSQVQNASVSGRITDPSGAVVPNAHLTAQDDATGMKYSTTSNSTGYYSFPTIPIGTYTVTVDADGFKKIVRSNITLEVGQSARVDFRLQLGSPVQVIQVTSSTPLLQTQSAMPQTAIRNRLVKNLPLSTRNWDDLMGLVAGVQGYRYTNQSGSTATGRFGGINVNGVRSLQNNFILDGVDNNTISENVQELSTEVIRPSVDAVREFKIITDPYSAEYGRSPGAAIIVTTKSGTNQFHGEAWEFNRTSATDATDFFTNRAGAKKPGLTQNQFGGNIGGPIHKNHAFFFFNYEGTRISQGVTRLSNVPLPNERAGDFSATAGAANGIIYTPIFDPTTGLPFPNNIIPPDRIDPVAAKILSMVPLPNVTPPPGPQNRENFLINPKLTNNADNYIARVDWQITPRNSVFVRYSDVPWSRFVPGPFGNSIIDGTETSAWGRLTQNSQGAALGWTAMISPRMVNSFRLGWGRNWSRGVQTPFGKNTLSSIGILGIPNSPLYDGGIPGMDFANVGGVNMPYLGSPDFLPKWQFTNQFEEGDTLNYMMGTHQFKFGVDYHFPMRNIYLDEPALRGHLYFDGQFTGNSLADFLLGYPYGAQESVFHQVDMRMRMQSYFAEDIWKVMPRLTLDLGFRYDYATWPYDASNQMTNLDLATGQLVYAKSGSGFSQQLVQPDKDNFAPRIGVAYQVTHNTVLRTGYGRFYQQFERIGSEDQMSLNPPWLLNVLPTVAQTDFTTPLFLLSQGFPASYRDVANIDLTSVRLRAVDPNSQMPTIDQWSAGFQRRFPFDIVTTVDYVGTKGTHLSYLLNLNQPNPPRTFNLPYPNLGIVEYRENGANSTYNGLEATVEKRFSHGLTFQVAYTYSKSIDDARDNLSGFGSSFPQDSYNAFAYDRGLSNFDFRNRFVFAYVYDFPLGREHRWVTKGFPSAILGNWRMNGIFMRNSGFPFTVTASALSSFVGPLADTRPNRLCNGSLASGQRSVNEWFSPACFAVPSPAAFGNSGRDILIGPPFTNLDFSLDRSFPFKLGSQPKQVDFRWEVFNLFNTPQFSIPSSDVSSPGTVGRITSLAGDPRVMQFALKLVF